MKMALVVIPFCLAASGSAAAAPKMAQDDYGPCVQAGRVGKMRRCGDQQLRYQRASKQILNLGSFRVCTALVVGQGVANKPVACMAVRNQCPKNVNTCINDPRVSFNDLDEVYIVNSPSAGTLRPTWDPVTGTPVREKPSVSNATNKNPTEIDLEHFPDDPSRENSAIAAPAR